MERNVYMYWVGNEYKLILILRRLIYLHSKNGKGYNVILLNENNISDYIDVPNYFNRLKPAHQADYVRVCILCERGGIWLDSDTLVIDKLDSLFDILESREGFLIKENNCVLWNGVFGSRSGTGLMLEWKRRMMLKLNRRKWKIRWTDIGSGMLSNIYESNNSLYKKYNILNGLDNMYPVNWRDCVRELIEKPYENYKKIERENQPLLVLVNSVYKSLESLSERDILEGKMPLNYFINKSYKNLYNDIMNRLFDKVIFIHCVNNIERKKNITEFINKFNLKNAYILEATCIKSNGVKGCAHSHYRAMEYCISNNLESVLIIEDDYWINESKEIIEKKLLEIFDIDWDVIMLYWFNNACIKRSEKVNDNLRKLKHKKYGWSSTLCYAVNKSMFRLLRESFKKSYDLMDDIYNHNRDKGIACDRLWLNLQLKYKWYIVNSKIGGERGYKSIIERN